MDMSKLFLDLYREKYGDHITRTLAEEIIKDLAVTDGSGRTTGEKWTYDEAKDMGDKCGVNWERVSKCEYYTVLNMLYSDYGQTAKKHGIAEIVMGEFARDWFADADAQPNKTFNYFMHF